MREAKQRLGGCSAYCADFHRMLSMQLRAINSGDAHALSTKPTKVRLTTYTHLPVTLRR